MPDATVPDAGDPASGAPGDPAPDTGLSVQLDVRDRRCVVVGGGPVATRRARSLQLAGARVTVVAAAITTELRALDDEGILQVHRREFRQSDLDPADPADPAGPHGADRVVLVVTATDDPAVNAAVAERAAALGALVNRADDAPAGDVSFPSVLRRGSVTIAVSTGVPVASQWVAGRLDEALEQLLGLDDQGLDRLVAVLSEVRRELRRGAGPGSGSAEHGERGVTEGPADWLSALDGSILELIHQGRTAEAKERLLACLSS